MRLVFGLPYPILYLMYRRHFHKWLRTSLRIRKGSKGRGKIKIRGGGGGGGESVHKVKHRRLILRQIYNFFFQKPHGFLMISGGKEVNQLA